MKLFRPWSVVVKAVLPHATQPPGITPASQANPFASQIVGSECSDVNIFLHLIRRFHGSISATQSPRA